MTTRKVFPRGFAWGVATAATQIEGACNEDGKGETIWDRFCRTPGHIANNDTTDVACDHYHRHAADIEEMKKLEITTYRFSISWARIFPNGPGKVNQKGLDFYRKLVDELVAAGITPNVTLYHWDLPQAFEDMGGWGNREIVKWFADYAELMFRELGDRVPFWATCNEPIAVYVGYGLGFFAPGYKDERLARQALHHLLVAHGEAVKRFREVNLGNSKIGIVIDIWKNHPARDCDEDRNLALLEDERCWGFFYGPIFRGKYGARVTVDLKAKNAMPEILDGDMKTIRAPMDFIGLNCYSRTLVSTDPNAVNLEKRKAAHPNGFTAADSEIYPKAIYDAIMIAKEYAGSLPIYITENGCCFDDALTPDKKVHDKKRIAYIHDYLSEIHRAIEDGADVRGYYLWSIMDNFEWSSGYEKRYGILYVDRRNLVRIWKDSAYWYQDVIRNNGITDI